MRYRTLIALFQMPENLESICRARNKEPCRANAETISCPASELAEILFSLRLYLAIGLRLRHPIGEMLLRRFSFGCLASGPRSIYA